MSTVPVTIAPAETSDQHHGTPPVPAELVLAARSGDPAAFASLYAHYLPVVEAVIRIEWRHKDDLADLLQETFERSWLQIGALRDPACFRPWLLQIARHSVIDHGRRVRRRPIAVEGNRELRCTAPDADPSEVVEAIDLLERVEHALDELSERDATVIRWAVLHGPDSAALAHAIDVEPGTAKVALHRARRRLRLLVS